MIQRPDADIAKDLREAVKTLNSQLSEAADAGLRVEIDGDTYEMALGGTVGKLRVRISISKAL